jgi:hypothetical protein
MSWFRKKPADARPIYAWPERYQPEKAIDPPPPGSSPAEYERWRAGEAMGAGFGPPDGYSVGESRVAVEAMGEGMVSVSIETAGRTVYLTMGPEQARHFAQLLADAAGTF